MDVPTVKHYEILDRVVEEVTGLCRDPAGRLVAERSTPGGRGAERVQLHIEWPTGLPPQDWTEDTIIAGEDNAFALTPTADGSVRVAPLPSCGGDTGYTWGYQGTGPLDLYRALVRGSLRTWQDPASWIHHFRRPESPSALWEAITTTGQTQPLRLPWPDVATWAAADRDRAQPALKNVIDRVTPGQVDSLGLFGVPETTLKRLEELLTAAGIDSSASTARATEPRRSPVRAGSSAGRRGRGDRPPTDGQHLLPAHRRQRRGPLTDARPDGSRASIRR